MVRGSLFWKKLQWQPNTFCSRYKWVLATSNMRSSWTSRKSTACATVVILSSKNWVGCPSRSCNSLSSLASWKWSKSFSRQAWHQGLHRKNDLPILAPCNSLKWVKPSRTIIGNASNKSFLFLKKTCNSISSAPCKFQECADARAAMHVFANTSKALNIANYSVFNFVPLYIRELRWSDTVLASWHEHEQANMLTWPSAKRAWMSCSKQATSERELQSACQQQVSIPFHSCDSVMICYDTYRTRMNQRLLRSNALSVQECRHSRVQWDSRVLGWSIRNFYIRLLSHMFNRYYVYMFTQKFTLS